ncbi:MAG: hypothetical protein RLZZ447_1135, partial [Verrucomicrobiota bacterium]
GQALSLRPAPGVAIYRAARTAPDRPKVPGGTEQRPDLFPPE